jgi:peroxiredoxin
MTSRLVLLGLAAGLVAFPFTSAKPEEPKPVADFSLTDPAGKPWSLRDRKAKVVVVAFLSAECPMSNAYLPVLADIHRRYGDKGVTLVGVFPDPEATGDAVAAHAKEYKVPFPVFADQKQASVASLGAMITPEVVVLDAKRVVRYRGRIDDRYNARLKSKPAATRHDLAVALDELLAGKPVSQPEGKALGCAISLPDKKPAAAGNAVTYYKDVLPVLQDHCQVCHRPGQVAPFSLTSYRQAVRWADLCLTEVQAKNMPPWKAAPNPRLAGERHLPPAAVKTLEAWVEQGMPEGDPKAAPPPAKFPEGWTFGEPDLVLEAPSEVTIAPSGPDIFRVLVFPTNFAEDREVVLAEILPGNPRVVHHTINVIDTTGTARRLQAEAEAKQDSTAADRGPGYAVNMGFGFLPDITNVLGGWAPGLLPKKLPDGTALRLPKGADVCIQIHYHRTGKEEKDRTKVGLYFAKKPATSRFKTIPVPGLFWAIPAGAKEHKVESAWRTTEDLTVYRVVPHMHLLGKDIELRVTVPGGTEETLIRIPAWDYNWQEQYDLKEPLKLPRGTLLRVRATYDNSADNPMNPTHPPKVVRLGEQTTDEMCFVFLGVSATGPFPQLLLPASSR